MRDQPLALKMMVEKSLDMDRKLFVVFKDLEKVLGTGL